MDLSFQSKLLVGAKDSTPFHSMLLLKLSGSDYNILSKKGSENTHANALSRNISIEIMEVYGALLTLIFTQENTRIAGYETKNSNMLSRV